MISWLGAGIALLTGVGILGDLHLLYSLERLGSGFHRVEGDRGSQRVDNRDVHCKGRGPFPVADQQVGGTQGVANGDLQGDGQALRSAETPQQPYDG